MTENFAAAIAQTDEELIDAAYWVAEQKLRYALTHPYVDARLTQLARQNPGELKTTLAVNRIGEALSDATKRARLLEQYRQGTGALRRAG